MSRGLLEKLRARVKDERYKSPAFSIGVTDPAATQSIIEITRQYFRVTVMGNSGLVAPNLDLNLTDDKYDTIGELCGYLQSLDGYSCTAADDIEYDHPSTDLRPLPPTSMGDQPVEMRTRLFSDEQLAKMVDEAARRHNPNYDGTSVPPEEEVFVLQLAQAVFMRTLANDAVKRKRLEEDTNSLLAIAASYEDAYERDTTRHQRVIASPTLTAQQKSNMREGDIVMGQLYRRSLRTGRAAPVAAAAPPTVPVFLEPQPEDEEDDNVTIRWERNTDNDFCSLELWRDTQPNVTRAPVWNAASFDYNTAYYEGVQRLKDTTSKLVFRTGASGTGTGFTNNWNGYGQMSTAFVDHGLAQNVGPVAQEYWGLEPDTEYFYRLYVINRAGDGVASDTIRVRTKKRRARIVSVAPNTLPRTGGIFTVQATHIWQQSLILIDGRALVGQTITPADVPENVGTITGTSPVFQVPGPKDVVLTSPNGLVHVLHAGLVIT
jgi:hypothetical protein